MATKPAARGALLLCVCVVRARVGVSARAFVRKLRGFKVLVEYVKPKPSPPPTAKLDTRKCEQLRGGVSACGRGDHREGVEACTEQAARVSPTVSGKGYSFAVIYWKMLSELATSMDMVLEFLVLDFANVSSQQVEELIRAAEFAELSEVGKAQKKTLEAQPIQAV